MDASLLSVLSAVLQTYASLLGIIGMFLVFLRQNKDSRVRDLDTRLRAKIDSLIDFVNREIAPVYDNEPRIRVDSQNCDEALEAIVEYKAARKNEIPRIGNEDIKRLLILWTFVEWERKDMLQLRNESQALSKRPIMPTHSFLFFVSFFALELLLGFSGVLLVMFEHCLQYTVTVITVIVAMVGLVPLGNLLYRIR